MQQVKAVVVDVIDWHRITDVARPEHAEAPRVREVVVRRPARELEQLAAGRREGLTPVAGRGRHHHRDVAELEAVEKATTSASTIPRKNGSTGSLATNRSNKV